MNEQEKFWADKYAKDYLKKNEHFDHSLLIKGWQKIVKQIEMPSSILECGANRGRNITALSELYPSSKISAIEISPDAVKILKKNFTDLSVYNQSIINSELTDKKFDLVFSMGVLIHIHPNELLDNLRKMIKHTNRYLIVGEYFNRTPVSIEYQGENDKLFKCDFGRLVIDNFSNELECIDYGFLWGHEYDDAGFDDITWWVFERK